MCLLGMSVTLVQSRPWRTGKWESTEWIEPACVDVDKLERPKQLPSMAGVSAIDFGFKRCQYPGCETIVQVLRNSRGEVAPHGYSSLCETHRRPSVNTGKIDAGTDPLLKVCGG